MEDWRICQRRYNYRRNKWKDIAIIGKEWDYSKGSNKNSDQSQAEEFTRGTITTDDSQAERKMLDFLCDLTTSYYADEVMKWIKSKVEIKTNPFW